MSFTVSIQDSTLQQCTSVSAVYLPKLYQFDDPHPDASIELLDVVETWKSLKPEQAHELHFWHNAFRAAIERYIHDTLVDNFNDAGITPDASQMHAYIQGLKYQQVMVDIDHIVADMIKQQQSSHRNCSWLEWDKRTALANFIRLHHCFVDDQPILHLYFYSEMTHGGGVQVYVRVCSKPQIFHVDHQSAKFVFYSPILDESKGLYPVNISEAMKDTRTDAWIIGVVTLFPDEVRFERVFRFRNFVQVCCLPSFISFQILH
jgi:hypothetical protein